MSVGIFFYILCAAYFTRDHTLNILLLYLHAMIRYYNKQLNCVIIFRRYNCYIYIYMQTYWYTVNCVYTFNYNLFHSNNYIYIPVVFCINNWDQIHNVIHHGFITTLMFTLQFMRINIGSHRRIFFMITHIDNSMFTRKRTYIWININTRNYHRL